MPAPVLAIANRAEIAVRIARTARAKGWRPTVLLGEPDWEGFAAREIGDVVRLNPGGEFDVRAVVKAALDAGATALHPGYGFLSERAELSSACAQAGITFIGPSPKTLELAGDKIATREIAVQHGVPVLPGSAALDLDDREAWGAVAENLGYPVIAKVAGAGGGRGLRVAASPDQLNTAIQSALNEAGGSGADQELFLEHYLVGARHVEVQVAGDGTRSIVIGDRDCSLQRRHQKVVEEAPAPGLSDVLRMAIHSAAKTMAEGISLLNLATVEFLVGADGPFFFMEINPRLQVEHTVTEEVTGLDLIALQLELASGGNLPENVAVKGHAIQARLYAEDPFQQFLPSPGLIRVLEFPRSSSLPGTSLRIDAGYAGGDSVPGSYDAMVAKVIVHAPDRDRAIAALSSTLEDLRVGGIATNRPWLMAALAEDSPFHSNTHDLATAGEIVLQSEPPADEVLASILSTSHAQGRATETAWGAIGSFRIVSDATATFHDADEFAWQKTITVSRTSRGSADPGPLVVAIDSGWEVVTSKGRWLVHAGPLPPRGHARAAGDGEIRAPMPGKVLQILVQAGQLVEDDEVVAVMEAMKMELSLAARFRGTVSHVSASEGDLVGLRQVLVSIEPAED